MAHEFESGFFVREPAWHGLGTVVNTAPTSADALHMAGLDWNVIQKPVYVDGRKAERYVANVRDSDNSVLGIVTKRYSIVQNTTAFDFTDNLIGNGVTYESAGSLRNGRTVWLLARLPREKILGDDIDPYICFTNSHDGFNAVRVCMTPIRVVCNNTLNLALNSAKRAWSTKHTGDIMSKLEEAKTTMKFANIYMNELKKEADILANSTITQIQVEELLSQMFEIPEDASDRKKKNIEAAKEEIMVCYLAPDLANFRDTKYGFINAIADYVDHTNPVKQSKNFNDNRFEKVVNGHILLDTAYDLLKAR